MMTEYKYIADNAWKAARERLALLETVADPRTMRALALAEIKRVNWHRPIRLYTSRMGRFNTLATENDFANLAEYEQYWNDWFATPAARTFLEKWDTLVEPGGAEELWDLAI